MRTTKMKTARLETHIFASHGLKHLLQLNSELLDVIDYDTWLTGEGEKSLHTLLSLSPPSLHPHPLSAWLFIVINQG